MDRLARYLHIDTQYKSPHQIGLSSSLAIIGGFYIASKLFSLSAWTWVHLLRPGRIHKYLAKNGDSWALVTGASAGIGKGFVQELAFQGFNLILHGRNEAKLQKLRAELEAERPHQKFEILVMDADDFDMFDMEAAVDKVKHLNIRILVNNVAGGGRNEKPLFDSLQNRTPQNVDSTFNVTARFTTHLTRLLLPVIIESAQPALILNVGSGISDMNVPYMCIYAGLKSYLKHWSECLQLDLQADGHINVEVLTIIVGQTSTEREERKISMMVPTSRQMARSSLAVAGYGRTSIAAYYGHAIQHALIGFLPSFMTQNLILNLARQMKADEREGKIL